MASLANTPNQQGQYVCQWYYSGIRFQKAFRNLADGASFLRFIQEEETKSKEQGKATPYIQELIDAKIKKAEKTGKQVAFNQKETPLETTWNNFIEDKSADTTKRTITNYKTTWTIFKKYTTAEKVTEITPDEIKAFKSELSKKQKARTVNVNMKRITTFLNWCLAHELINKSPMKNIKQLSVDELPKPYLTKEEFLNILKEAKLVSKDITLFVALGFYAGLRRTEIQSLKMSNINGNIIIRSRDNFRVKNRKFRTIPIHPELRALLNEYCSEYSADDYVVAPNKTNSKYLEYRYNYQLPLDKTLKAAKMETVNKYGDNQPITPHIFRHSFCSNCLMSGLSIFEVAKYSGHTTKVLEDTYGHLIVEKMNQISF